MFRIGIIYRAHCLPTGKSYIGLSTKTLASRKLAHERGKNESFAMIRAMKEFGKDNFEWTELCCGLDMWGLQQAEKYFIAKYDAFHNGYNLTEGGADGTHSKETIAKLRKKQLGKVTSEETKAKQRAANIGQVPWNKGLKMSAEKKREREAERRKQRYEQTKHLKGQQLL